MEKHLADDGFREPGEGVTTARLRTQEDSYVRNYNITSEGHYIC